MRTGRGLTSAQVVGDRQAADGVDKLQALVGRGQLEGVDALVLGGAAGDTKRAEVELVGVIAGYDLFSSGSGSRDGASDGSLGKSQGSGDSGSGEGHVKLWVVKVLVVGC